VKDINSLWNSWHYWLILFVINITVFFIDILLEQYAYAVVPFVFGYFSGMMAFYHYK
jgi:hypothetical protein